jgi:enoyl-CoA hydratase/carnithine racemase
MPDPIVTRRDGAIALVTLNRPERRNALDLEAWRRLAVAFGELAADESLRCVVLRGAGGHFCAGADIAEFDERRADPAQALVYGKAIEAAMDAVAGCPHPTLALIEGACVGGGLEVASVCDLRVCARSSRFGIPVSRIGVTMAHAELRGLLALVGPAAALEILLGGEVFGSKRALRLGLVNRVHRDERVEKKALGLARRVAAGAPLVHRWHKRFVRQLVAGRPLVRAEHDEAFAFAATEDYRLGREAFLAKRTPGFLGR